MKQKFPNRSGDREDTDAVLSAELKEAGINNILEKDEASHPEIKSLLRETSGEVKTSVRGSLHGWQFERGWYYWMAKGPGIDVDTAEELHATHGQEVRVAGHCGCPSPREWYKGLACGSYHIDTPDGLKALADTIKGQVAKAELSKQGSS